MAANRAQQAAHQKVRRLVLARLQAEEPDLFTRWWMEARAQVAAEQEAE